MAHTIDEQYNQFARQVLAEMKIEEMMMNGVPQTVEQLIEKASDDAKKQYMTRVWSMTKDQIFHELMRVQGEASKLLMQAQAEIERLRALTDPEDGDAIH
jgi:20S proteasome alpha/beta subunit